MMNLQTLQNLRMELDENLKLTDSPCSSSLQYFKSLLQFTSKCALLHDDEIETIKDSLEDAWKSFITNSSILSNIWAWILQLCSQNPSEASSEAKLFFCGYRIVFNFFKASTDVQFEFGAYTTALLDSLCCLKGPSVHFQHAAEILFEQSNQIHYLWLWRGAQGVSNIDQVLSAISSQFALHLISISFKLFDRITNSTNSNLNLSRMKEILLTLSSSAIDSNSSPQAKEEFIAHIFLRHSLRDPQLTIIAIEAVKEALTKPGNQSSPTLHILIISARLWSEKMFVLSPQNKKAQLFLTRVILHCLECEEITKEVISSTSQSTYYGGNGSVALLLSMGVSHYLDSSDKTVRLHGMRVARSFSLKMGRKMHFQELEDLEVLPAEEVAFIQT